MKNYNHTPAPWAKAKRISQSDSRLHAVLNSRHSDCQIIIHGADPEEEDAVATLIAAAPSMFNELNELQEKARINKKLLKALKDIADEANHPEFHSQGMGCGLEDRGIRDRYDAMEYGWSRAIEKMHELVIAIAVDAIKELEEKKS